MSLKQAAIHSVKWNAISAVTTVGVQVARTIILARILEPRDYGLMGMLMVVMGFADAFCDAGITSSIIHRQVENRRTLSSLFWFNLGTGITVYFVLLALTPLVVWYYHEPVLAALSAVLFLSVIFRSLGRQFEAILAKDLKFKQIARVEVVSSVLSLLIAIGFAEKGFGAWSLVFSQVGKVGIQGLVQLSLNWKQHRPQFEFHWSDVKPHVGFGLFQLGEMNVRYLAQRFDQLILARMLGAGALGYYNYAYQLVLLPINRINPIVTRVAFPVFAKIQNDQERLRDLYMRVIHLLSIVNAPALVFMAVLAPRFVPLLLGDKWIPSVQLIQLFSLVAFSRSIGSPLGSLLQAKGRPDLGLYQNIALMLLNLPITYIGIVKAGAPGAILGLLLVQLIINVPSYFLIFRRLIGSCGWRFTRSWSFPLLAASLSGVVVAVMDQFLLQGLSSWVILCLDCLAGLVLYGGITYWMEPDILEQIQKIRERGKD